MSTHWGYKCRTCGDVSDQWYNHGQAILRDLWKWRRYVWVLLKKSEFVTVRCGYAEDSAPCWWVVEHIDHDVCLYNEYGEEEKL